MQCANCLRDFKEDEKEKGFYTQQNTHFMRPFRQFGYVCPACGYHNTIFHVPVKVPFIRSGRNYDKLDSIVEKFRKDVEEFYKERVKLKNQLSLYENDTETK